MRAKKAKKILDVSGPTLTKYRREGWIKATRNKINRYWEYDEDSVYNYANKQDKRKTVVYGRVSTSKQSKDLDNQINTLMSYANCKGDKIDTIYKDIASGLTFDRQEFKKLVTSILRHEIKRVYITYKDRLSRVSFDMWKSVFSECDCELIVLNTSDSEEKEIFEDIISMLHCFAMRMYSKRRKKKLQLIEEDLINGISTDATDQADSD